MAGLRQSQTPINDRASSRGNTWITFRLASYLKQVKEEQAHIKLNSMNFTWVSSLRRLNFLVHADFSAV
jgi:hypothetical protein